MLDRPLAWFVGVQHHKVAIRNDVGTQTKSAAFDRRSFVDEHR